MKGYAESIVFSAEQIADFHLASAIVAGLDEKQDDGDWVRCHELARAVSVALNAAHRDDHWAVVDGQFGGAEHSWLVWSGRGRIILDVYAVGEIPQVKLVDCGTLWRRSDYTPQGRRRDVRFAVFGKLKALSLEIAGTVRRLNRTEPAESPYEDAEGHPRDYDPETNTFRTLE